MKSTTRSSLGFLIAVITLGWSPCGLGEDVEGIVEKVRAAYRNLDVYQSHGTVETDVQVGGRPLKTITKFELRLQRPELFRVTWEQQNEMVPGYRSGGAAWIENGEAFSQLSGMKKQKRSSGQLALAAATGVSQGAAHTIPSLFFGEEHGGSSMLQDSSRLQQKPDEVVNGEPCFVLHGPNLGLRIITLWISKNDFLIRKLASVYGVDGEGMEVDVPETSDAKLKAALERAKGTVEAEALAEVKRALQEAKKRAGSNRLKGGNVETHSMIETATLKPEDFIYKPSVDQELPSYRR